ncbi:MAG: MlaE family ABC transporter permease, partial [Planctomycetaceae bacterium]
FTGGALALQIYAGGTRFNAASVVPNIVAIAMTRELGPVLGGLMVAGRVSASIAAELGTMRVTEQIDALRALGANPIRHLVVPRFMACFLMIPLLTAVADVVGIIGGWFFSTQALGINSFHYWYHAKNYVYVYDVFDGLCKSVFFGGAIALISCHRGFNCGAGAEGVGRAATEAFVFSFVAILVLDFFLGVLSNTVYYMWFSAPTTLM